MSLATPLLALTLTMATVPAGPLGASPLQRAEDEIEVAPFDAMRFADDGTPIVTIGDVEGRLLRIQGTGWKDLRGFCRRTWGKDWGKRLVEDMSYALFEMGVPLARKVEVELELADGKPRKLPGVVMTEARRAALKRAGVLPANDGDEPRVRGPRPRFAQSPFDGIDWAGGKPIVRVGDLEGPLVSIDGVPLDKLLGEAAKVYGRDLEKRFCEDLPAVLFWSGFTARKRVELVIRDDGGKEHALAKVEMTEDKRRAVMNARRAIVGVPAAARAAAVVDPDAAWKAFATLLDERWSYRGLRAEAVDEALAKLAPRSGDAQPAAFLRRVQAVLDAGGDGHSRLGSRDWREAIPVDGVDLPFLVAKAREGFVAFSQDRTGWLDPGHPFVVSLDGLPLRRWLEASADLTVHGSPQWRDHRAVRGLRELGALRRALGRDTAGNVVVELADTEGDRVRKELRTDRGRPIYGMWPRGGGDRFDQVAWKLLDGGYGWLRIPVMDGDARFLARIDEGMKALADTRGLVVDVRGNGGGSRDALRRLLPWLLADGEHVVANVAAYRLGPDEDGTPAEGWLANRFLYPAGWDGWSDGDRAAIAACAKGFEPEWKPGPGRFSDWHYMVVDRDDNPTAGRYEGPVVVLIDSGCFSATDVFVGAFAGRKGVKLVGLPTGGGSGRAREYRIPGTQVTVRLSSMASFRPDGRLYDGRGIAPDVLVEPDAAYFIGEGDNQLTKALAVLRGMTGGR